MPLELRCSMQIYVYSQWSAIILPNMSLSLWSDMAHSSVNALEIELPEVRSRINQRNHKSIELLSP